MLAHEPQEIISLNDAHLRTGITAGWLQQLLEARAEFRLSLIEQERCVAANRLAPTGKAHPDEERSLCRPEASATRRRDWADMPRAVLGSVFRALERKQIGREMRVGSQGGVIRITSAKTGEV